jgi:hypothetical protein
MFMHASWSHLLGNMWLIGAIIGVPIAAALQIVVEELTAPTRARIAAADQQSPATNGVVSARGALARPQRWRAAPRGAAPRRPFGGPRWRR